MPPATRPNRNEGTGPTGPRHSLWAWIFTTACSAAPTAPRVQRRAHRGPVRRGHSATAVAETGFGGGVGLELLGGWLEEGGQGHGIDPFKPCSPPRTGSATGSGQVSWLCKTAHRAPAIGHCERREKACAQFGREANPTVLNTHEWGAPSEAFIERFAGVNLSAGSQPFASTGRRLHKEVNFMARVVEGGCWSLVALSVSRLTMALRKAATAHVLACGIRASTSTPVNEAVGIHLAEMVSDATEVSDATGVSRSTTQ
jgi:hypothetical protein